MKNKSIKIISLIALSTALIAGCSNKKTVDLNILATTDLHGEVPYELASYVKDESKKDKNITLVDAGDFFDGSLGDMLKYSDEIYQNRKNNIEKYVEFPMAKEMKDVGYDAVVLGNHEFISNDKFTLDNIASDFEKQGIDLLSANTYNKNGESYVKPYTIKDIETTEGTVKLGVLGLTIKEVGEKFDVREDGELVPAKSRELKDQAGYDGKLYMNDLVEDAKKWVKVMKEDNADVIVAVVHSGEKPKKPKNPGNKIQELAQEVDGIDAIVAGHTHKQFAQHDYKNKSGETVIVTQPGKHGECISKINLELVKNKNSWNVINKSSDLVEFEKSPEDDNFGELIYKISSIDKNTPEVRLSDIIPFKWDKAYAFKTGTPREVIYDTVGYKWRGITETESDDMLQMVFMNGKKVVCYVYEDMNQMGMSFKFNESEYKDNVLTIAPGDNDNFTVKKGEDIFDTDLTQTQK